MRQTILWSDVLPDVYTELESDESAIKVVNIVDYSIRAGTVVSYYDDETETESKEIHAMKNRMIQFMKCASERYSPLISALSANKDKLLADVDTTSRSWFNDAPSAKNADASGEDLTHLSTYSKSVSSSAYGTPMQRIKELDDEIMNVYERWAREFISAFSLEREY